jgi:hypothetical protein
MGRRPQRLVFVDETGTTTKMTQLRGRARRAERLRMKAPFGHWGTQTFIAALRHDGLTALWVIDCPINRRIFEAWVETQFASTLRPGDMVILDNLSSKKRKGSCDPQGARRMVPLPPALQPRPQPYRSFGKLRRPSPSSRRTCARQKPGPSRPFGKRSAQSPISTRHRNAGATSECSSGEQCGF